MKLIDGVRGLTVPLDRSVLTIGNFDGVHLGHQALLAELLARANELRVPSVIMTFEPHPVKVLHPDRHMRRLFDFEDQRSELEKRGVDFLIVEPFSREFSQLEPGRFILDWLYKPLNPACVIVGYDFSFGADKSGSIEFLKQQGLALGFEVEVVPPIKAHGQLVSSSRIRKAVAEGDMQTANALLGRPFYLRGLVVRGAGRGRTIGIPTANIRSDAETVPREGVYAVWAWVGADRKPAVLNIGRNPTFTESAHAASIECHLLDFTADLYGRELKIDCIQRLRDERKFSGSAELVKQIHADITNAKEIFAKAGLS